MRKLLRAKTRLMPRPLHVTLCASHFRVDEDTSSLFQALPRQLPKRSQPVCFFSLPAFTSLQQPKPCSVTAILALLLGAKYHLSKQPQTVNTIGYPQIIKADMEHHLLTAARSKVVRGLLMGAPPQRNLNTRGEGLQDKRQAVKSGR